MRIGNGVKVGANGVGRTIVGAVGAFVYVLAPGAEFCDQDVVNFGAVVVISEIIELYGIAVARRHWDVLPENVCVIKRPLQ